MAQNAGSIPLSILRRNRDMEGVVEKATDPRRVFHRRRLAAIGFLRAAKRESASAQERARTEQLASTEGR